MSRLHDKLIDNYADYFSRNHDPGDEAFYSYIKPDYDSNFGYIVDPFPKDAEILELGCGFGELLKWLSLRGREKLTGVDLSPSQLEVAKKRVPDLVKFKNSDATAFVRDHPDQFDLIFAIDIIEHIPTRDEVRDLLEGILGALKLGGIFIGRVPNMANLCASYLLYKDLTHYHGYTSSSIIQLLSVVGFQDPAILRFRPADKGQMIRVFIEDLLHYVLFRICGYGEEKHFRRFLICQGKKFA